MKTCSDEELAARSQAGSLAAFEELVYRYEHRIYGFVAQSCRNGADAREITQDTFVKAFQAIDQFDERHAFAAWLFTIARRKCIDHYRAAPPLADGPAPDVADLADPRELLAAREERHNLWQFARRHLPETQFHALWLRYVEDLSISEIAPVLRKTQTHVKVLLFRARRTLGRLFHESNARTEAPRLSPRDTESRCPAATMPKGAGQNALSQFTFHVSRL